MPPAQPATAAIVVIYRPRGDPAGLLQSLRAQLSQVVVVDNSEAGWPGLAEQAAAVGAAFIHARNIGGLAGAYNRAREWLATHRPDIERIVLLDDDSDTTVLAPFLADPEVQQLLQHPGTAAVAPIYRDRATGLRGKHLRLARWRMDWLPREFDGLQRVSFIINSMSVWRTAALAALGPHDETLAVDHVDTDMCLRAAQAGLALYVDGSYAFDHAIGERKRFRLLGREMQAGGHGPARRQMIGRNTVWLARRYGRSEPAFALLCLARLGYEAVGIVAAEDHRGAKLRALWRGCRTGLSLRRRP